MNDRGGAIGGEDASFSGGLATEVADGAQVTNLPAVAGVERCRAALAALLRRNSRPSKQASANPCSFSGRRHVYVLELGYATRISNAKGRGLRPPVSSPKRVRRRISPLAIPT